MLGSSFVEPKLGPECSGWVLGQGDLCASSHTILI